MSRARRASRSALLLAVMAAALAACGPPADEAGTSAPPGRIAAGTYAIAIHGGAGTVDQDAPAELLDRYERSLERALGLGQRLLESGGTSLDAVETVVRAMEDDPLFNAGRGAVFNAEGRHELDASIMDGRDLSAGAVAGVTRLRNPISAARLVMEETRHVLLAGPAADAFAESHGLETVENSYFATERRRESWRRARERLAEAAAGSPGGTVGAVALDRHGNLAAATSTGGLTNKMHGRIGDTPIVGAGTYADNRGAAVSCTGAGEEFIRHGVAHTVSLLVSRDGVPLDAAARLLIDETLRRGDGGLIAVDARGNAALFFSTQAMPRGVADSGGRFETMIW